MNNQPTIPLLLNGDGDYEMKKLLKSDLFEVYKKSNKESEILKILMMDGLKEEDIDKYLLSVSLLSGLKADVLMNYKSIMRENNYIYMVMDKYGKSLDKIVNPVEYFEENGIFGIIMSICKGTKIIHENGLMNGNLNLHNILLNEENEVKISDYCKMLLYKNSRSEMVMKENKVKYMSPEMMENKEVNEKSDIWSIGCILYYLLSDKEMFSGKSIFEIHDKIMRNEYELLVCEFKDELNELLGKILKVEIESRLSIDDLINEIEKINSIQYIPSAPFINNPKPAISYSDCNPGIIGIDIGISNSACGIYRSGRVELVPYNDSNRSIPNYVYYNPNNKEIVVGNSAIGYIKTPSNRIYDSQKFIGLSYNHRIVQEEMKKWPFKIINDNGIPKIELQYNNETVHLSATDITSEILKKIKENADQFYGQNVKCRTKAVITYPFHFTENQINETRLACERANIQVIDLIPEPVAALIVYLYYQMKEEEIKGEKNYLIFNFTKTRFDITICNVDFDNKLIKIIGYDVDLDLGGENIDYELVNHYKELYEKETGDELRPKQIFHLQKACEDAKCLLSAEGNEDALVDSELLEENDIDTTLTRDLLYNICESVFTEIESFVDNVLKKCKLSPKDISNVILCGRSSRIPRIQELLRYKFPGSYIRKDINPDEIFAYGATVYAKFEEFHYNIVNDSH